jgi:ABC-2 type transport system ATP-binding protein
VAPAAGEETLLDSIPTKGTRQTPANSRPPGPTVNQVAIRIEGLTKTYPGPRAVRALDGVDLEVTRGEIFGLLGPNGAGKTTTVGVCTTLALPTGARVTVEGVDVVAEPSWVKSIVGVVTQYNTLDRSCTVWENLYYHCRYFGMSGFEARKLTDELLEQFKLSDRGEAMVAALSGGLAQRLQIARAIAHRPTVLFMDEPSAGLDPQGRLALWEMIGGMRPRGNTVMLTTHYMEEADRLSDRVAIIDHGKVLVCDRPAELKRTLGAETVIEVHLERADQALATALAALPGVTQATVTPAGIRVLAHSRERLLPRLVEATQSHGLRDLSVTEPTLETVFIQLTGRDLRE